MSFVRALGLHPRPRALRALAAAAVVAACASIAAPLAAQTPPPHSADAAFDAGVAARDRGDWPAAYESFRRSQALEPATGTLLNLALCEEQVGKTASAAEHLEQVLLALAPADNRAPIARAHLDAIRPRVPRLTLRLDPSVSPDATATLDGAALSADRLGAPIRLDPGPHVVIVRASGRGERRFDVTLKEAEALDLSIAAGEPSPILAPPPRPPPPPVEPPPQPPLVEQPPPQSTGSTAGLLIGGVGAVALVGGAVAGILAIGAKGTVDAKCMVAKEQCETQAGIDAANRGRTFALASNVGFAVGLAGLGLGAYLVFRDHASAPPTARPTAPSTAPQKAALVRGLARAAIGPALVPGGGGLLVVGRF